MDDFALIERVMDASQLDPAEFGALLADATMPRSMWVGDRRSTELRTLARSRLRSLPEGDKLLAAEDKFALDAVRALPVDEREQVAAHKDTYHTLRESTVDVTKVLRDGEWHYATEFKQPAADYVLTVLYWAGCIRASDTGPMRYQWK